MCGFQAVTPFCNSLLCKGDDTKVCAGRQLARAVSFSNTFAPVSGEWNVTVTNAPQDDTRICRACLLDGFGHWGWNPPKLLALARALALVTQLPLQLQLVHSQHWQGAGRAVASALTLHLIGHCVMFVVILRPPRRANTCKEWNSGNRREPFHTPITAG